MNTRTAQGNLLLSIYRKLLKNCRTLDGRANPSVTLPLIREQLAEISGTRAEQAPSAGRSLVEHVLQDAGKLGSFQQSVVAHFRKPAQSPGIANALFGLQLSNLWVKVLAQRQLGMEASATSGDDAYVSELKQGVHAQRSRPTRKQQVFPYSMRLRQTPSAGAFAVRRPRSFAELQDNDGRVSSSDAVFLVRRAADNGWMGLDLTTPISASSAERALSVYPENGVTTAIARLPLWFAGDYPLQELHLLHDNVQLADALHDDTPIAPGLWLSPLDRAIDSDCPRVANALLTGSRGLRRVVEGSVLFDQGVLEHSVASDSWACAVPVPRASLSCTESSCATALRDSLLLLEPKMIWHTVVQSLGAPPASATASGLKFRTQPFADALRR